MYLQYHVQVHMHVTSYNTCIHYTHMYIVSTSKTYSHKIFTVYTLQSLQIFYSFTFCKAGNLRGVYFGQISVQQH